MRKPHCRRRDIFPLPKEESPHFLGSPFVVREGGEGISFRMVSHPPSASSSLCHSRAKRRIPDLLGAEDSNNESTLIDALSTRLFPFPYGKGLGVRLPRAAKTSPVYPDA